MTFIYALPGVGGFNECNWPLGRLVRHDDCARGSEHAADPMADRDLGIGDLRGAMPRIWRTLSCNAYMPHMPECM
jgi:hypothetical protein